MTRPPEPARTGACDGCGFDWNTDAAMLVDYLTGVHAMILSVALTVEPSERSDAGEPWSPLAYLGHLADAAQFFGDRIDRVLTKDEPDLPVGRRLAELVADRDHAAVDAADLAAALTDEIERILGSLPPSSSREWQRGGQGESARRTVLDLVRRLAHELHHHLGDAIGRMAPWPYEPRPVGPA